MNKISDIKMIATDLDNTLLKNDKTISAFTESILAELRNRNILFVLATARPIRAVKEPLPYLKYDAAAFHNGAVIFVGDTLLGNFGIKNPTAVTSAILEHMPDSKISIEANDVMYSNYNIDEIRPWVVYTKTKDFHEIEHLTADKIILEINSLEAIEAFLPYIPDDLYPQLIENQLTMIMNKQATKANAVRLMAAYYGISMNQVAAFGDDYNDIGMLQECGIGIATGGALDEVKEIADFVCESSEQDGVARWISENIL